MTEINHEIKIQAARDSVFNAMTTLDGLKSWHTANIEGNPQSNGTLTIKAAGKPTFKWKIVNTEPEKLTWECIEGPGDSVGTQAIFKLSKTDDAKTLVECRHVGWPGTHDNFRKCNTLWAIILYHLKNYVETGKVNPAFK